MANIKDVAKKAGVSIATVSRVINESGFVSEELKTKVVNAMETLDFKPNIIARSLRSNKTNIIGLLIPNNSDPMFAELSNEIEQILFELNYNLILCNTLYDENIEKKYLDSIISRRIDGIIIVPVNKESTHINKIVKSGVPVVVLERIMVDPIFDIVCTDDFDGAYKAADYLIKMGHRKIGYIDRPVTLPHSIERISGIRRAFEKNMLVFREDLIVKGGFSYLDGSEAMKKILQIDPEISAVMTFGDIPAIGAIRYINDRGLFVPEDISVIGFDDITQCSYSIPRLTTVHVEKIKIARAACEIITKRINSVEFFERQEIFIKPRLVIRESVIRKK